MWAIVNTNLGSGGAERHLLQIARFLEPPDGRLKLILLDASGKWLDEGTTLGMEAMSEAMPKSGIARVLWCFAITRRLRHRLRAEMPDVLVTFLWFPTLVTVVALLGMRTRPQLVWSLQSDLDRDFRLHRDWRVRRALVRLFVVPVIDCFIASSRGVCNTTQRFLGVPRYRLPVIPNSIDIQRIDQLASAQTTIPTKRSDVTRIVSLGRLHPQKGFDVLLQALGSLAQERADWECYILGEGDQRDELIALRHELMLDHKVTFVGFADNPVAWLRSGDIFVLPSRWEPFGIAMVEAMAVGIPVVVSNTDGAQDLVSSGENGLTFRTGDFNQLRDRLLLLLDSPEVGRKLGRAGRNVSRSYDARKIAARYENEIARCCKNRRARRRYIRSRTPKNRLTRGS